MTPHDELAVVASFGLPGAPTALLDVGSPDRLLEAAMGRRVLPWLAATVDADLVNAATPEFRERLRAQHLVAVQTTMAAHATAAAVVERLRTAGIDDVRILKGCATAHLDHQPSGARAVDRFSSDVDLLIAPDLLPDVLAVFPDTVVPAPRRQYWQQHYGKATTVHDESKVDIDVHTMLSQGYFGLVIAIDELFASSDDFAINGVAMHGLDGPNRLIHAANHVAASPWTGLHSMRDVLQLVLVTGVDWQEAVDRSLRWRVDGLFAKGVVEAWDSFAVEPHPIVEWASGHEPRARQRLAFRLAGDRPRGHLLTAPLALPPHRWPGYVLPLVFPSRAYLTENGKQWRERTGSMLAELRPR